MSKGILWAVGSPPLSTIPMVYPLGRPHHVTLQFGVERSDWEQWIGFSFSAEATRLCWNERIMAIAINLPPNVREICSNKHPHISVCWMPGVSPVESNAMLDNPVWSCSVSYRAQFTIQFLEWKQ